MVTNVERGFGARSSARQLSALRGFFRFLVRERASPRIPTDARRPPEARRASSRACSPSSEVERLLAAPDTHDRSRRAARGDAPPDVRVGAAGERARARSRSADLDLQRGLVSAARQGRQAAARPGRRGRPRPRDALPARRAPAAAPPGRDGCSSSRRAAGRFTREGFWRMVRRYAVGRRDRAPALAAQAPALVRDAPASRRRRPARRAGHARPRRPRDDRDLHARARRTTCAPRTRNPTRGREAAENVLSSRSQCARRSSGSIREGLKHRSSSKSPTRGSSRLRPFSSRSRRPPGPSRATQTSTSTRCYSEAPDRGRHGARGARRRATSSTSIAAKATSTPRSSRALGPTCACTTAWSGARRATASPRSRAG